MKTWDIQLFEAPAHSGLQAKETAFKSQLTAVDRRKREMLETRVFAANREKAEQER